MNKYSCILLLQFSLFSLFLSAQSIDHSFALGFNGNYRENSWTPLIIRLSNHGKSLSGQLIVETENSSTAYEQKRQYIKPLDLPSGSLKEISFVLPLGHHSNDIRYYFQSEEILVFENTISLKQKGVKRNLILGVSPFPDLGYLNKHPIVDSRAISYPHVNNLPENSNAYDSVDIISMHREMMDKLSGSQFEALTGWVNQGGVFVVWGGKSPSPDKWNYLPSTIKGLKRIEIKTVEKFGEFQLPAGSFLINSLETENKNSLISYNGDDLISRRKSGLGTVYFVSFDYSGKLRNWQGLNELWNIIFDSEIDEDAFTEKMREYFLLEDYISILDHSGFNYQDKMNSGLILFLSLSAFVSLLIFIRFRRKSVHLYTFIACLMIFLLLLSSIIYISLYSKKFRTDCFIVSSNVIYSHGLSDQSHLFKDILVGSSNKTSSDIIIHDDTRSVLKQEKFENLIIFENPEIHINNIQLGQWSSKIFRLERSMKNILTMERKTNYPENTVVIQNHSDYFIHNTFLYKNGSFLNLRNLHPWDTMTIEISDFTDNGLYTNSNILELSTVELYTGLFRNEEVLVFGGIINEELFPLSFSQETWKKKTINLILATDETEGDKYE